MNHVMELSDFTKEELVDINSVAIDLTLPREDRITEFLKQIRNPYHFKCGQIEVHACYSSEGPSLSDCLKQLIDG